MKLFKNIGLGLVLTLASLSAGSAAAGENCQGYESAKLQAGLVDTDRASCQGQCGQAQGQCLRACAQAADKALCQDACRVAHDDCIALCDAAQVPAEDQLSQK